jgi:hypothetical protein
MITPQERETYVADFQRAPRRVKAAAGFACLLGIIILLRFVATGYAGRMPFGSAALFGLLVFAVFVGNGCALLGRKRWAYVALAILAALPLLNLLAASVHLLRQTLEGTAASNIPESLINIVALGQLAVTCVLLRQLLASETREFVWKARSAEPPSDLQV